jgi:23S rRNA (uracil1939-C5)-methyltransferase
MNARATLRRKPPEPAQVLIERLGAEGDGIAHLPDGTPLYVPLTLPGETVIARPLQPRGGGWHAVAEAISYPSGSFVSEVRVKPPCRHFGRCGGCVLQHWRDGDYRAWKAGLLSSALQHAGSVQPPPIQFVPGRPAERRRIDFAARRVGNRILLGLHAQRSSDVVNLDDCLVLHPRLMALIQPLRTLLQGIHAMRREASVVINLLDAGPDVLLRTDAALTLADRMALTDFARLHGLPRISHAAGLSRVRGDDLPEPIGVLLPASIELSGVVVRPPPGAFLQATAAGERAIVEAVLREMPARVTSKTRIAELYAGCGTLTFALARVVRVAAFEGEAAIVAALRQAINDSGMAGRIEAVQRDLVRRPLSASELAPFAAVVLDPPHAGAAAQIGQIAAAGVAAVVYVSCNPTTLARDAGLLCGAGYHLAAVTAIDQFLWSARLESVSVFRRA